MYYYQLICLDKLKTIFHYYYFSSSRLILTEKDLNTNKVPDKLRILLADWEELPMSCRKINIFEYIYLKYYKNKYYKIKWEKEKI